MSGVLDYLEWRGDLTFEMIPFCDADYLVLCCMAYLPFDGVVSSDFTAGPVALTAALAEVQRRANSCAECHALYNREDARLIALLLHSPRFAGTRLIGYVNSIDDERQEQFSAYTAFLPDGSTHIVFRGTDDTVVGWKEDFSIGFRETVPAQLDAVAYTENAAARIEGGFWLSGHSKGGNLAVYAAAFCAQPVQNRIIAVRNLDGPGFNEKTIDAPGFIRIADRTRTYLPQSSVVGMLLNHSEDFVIVHSTSSGLAQHDIYTWEVTRSGFQTVSARTTSSHFIDLALRNWIVSMTPEMREKFVDGMFSMLDAADIKTMHNFWSRKNMLALARAARKLDKESRGILLKSLRILSSSLKESLPSISDRNNQ